MDRTTAFGDMAGFAVTGAAINGGKAVAAGATAADGWVWKSGDVA